MYTKQRVVFVCIEEPEHIVLRWLNGHSTGLVIGTDGLAVGERKQKTWRHVTQVMVHCSRLGVAGQTASCWGDRGRRSRTGSLRLARVQGKFVCLSKRCWRKFISFAQRLRWGRQRTLLIRPVPMAVMDDFVRSLLARHRGEQHSLLAPDCWLNRFRASARVSVITVWSGV